MTLRTSITVRAAIALLALGVVATGLALAGCGSTKAVATPTGRASGKPGQGGGDPTSMVTSRLAALVTKGTITSAQERAVASAVASSMTGNRPSGSASPSPGAQSQKQGAMFSSALATLVSKGTITSAQESAIATALSKGTQGAGGQPPSGGQAPSTG